MTAKEDIQEFLRQQQLVEKQLPKTIEVCGKSYKVRQIGKMARTKVDNIAKEAWFIEKQCKEEMTLRKAKILNSRLRSTHSRMAAYYLLGNWALFVPFLHAITWRWLELKNNETVFSILNTGVNDPDTTFFFGCWEITKGVLGLSTKSVGDGARQMQERQESSESMLDEDALPKKEEDGKSRVSSSPRRTTKR